MPQASEIAWLIPVFPLIGAVFSGLGLICANKKINNSREIVSISLLSFVGVSAVISYKTLIEQINGYQSVEKLFVWASAGDFHNPNGIRSRPIRERNAHIGNHYYFISHDLLSWLYGS
jgi:NAD(P)H-quinone oxidoreductase subunit 5